MQSRLGGGEGVEGIYGSITATGMHKVLDCMKHNCGLGRNSTLVDMGAGLGRWVGMEGCMMVTVTGPPPQQCMQQGFGLEDRTMQQATAMLAKQGE